MVPSTHIEPNTTKPLERVKSFCFIKVKTELCDLSLFNIPLFRYDLTTCESKNPIVL